MLSEKELEEIEARLNNPGLSKGPWKKVRDCGCGDGDYCDIKGISQTIQTKETDYDEEYLEFKVLSKPDAEFIANARTDIPKLIDEVKLLKSVIDEMVNVK